MYPLASNFLLFVPLCLGLLALVLLFLRHRRNPSSKVAVLFPFFFIGWTRILIHLWLGNNLSFYMKVIATPLLALDALLAALYLFFVVRVVATFNPCPMIQTSLKLIGRLVGLLSFLGLAAVLSGWGQIFFTTMVFIETATLILVLVGALIGRSSWSQDLWLRGTVLLGAITTVLRWRWELATGFALPLPESLSLYGIVFSLSCLLTILITLWRPGEFRVPVTPESRVSPPKEQRVTAEATLSDRELEVAKLLALGKRYKEIGDTLFIAPSTVKTHVLRIYEKLGVNNKVQLSNTLREMERRANT